tara:strand:- start:682 stop:975 length:294 start_codon:yes stop_codon:yes gene_type:complete
MLGYDSPELKPRKDIPNRDIIIKKAVSARDFLKGYIDQKVVDIQLSGFDKYGRSLSTIYVEDPAKNSIICKNKLNINDLMVRNGHGYNYMGGTKKSF